MKNITNIYKKIFLFAATIFIFVGIFSARVYATDNSLRAGFVQQQGDWIYYLDDGNNCLSKIKTDGTGYTKITDTDIVKFLIVDDWIYYIDYFDSYTTVYDRKGSLYRININGTGKEKIFNLKFFNNTVERTVKNLEYSNNYLTFYCKGDMYKMSITDLNPIKLDVLDEIERFDMRKMENQNGYLIGEGSYCFYKFNLETYEITTFPFEGYISDFVCDDEWIYYVKSSKLYKVKHDGSELTFINDFFYNVRNLYLFNDKLYYCGKTKFDDEENYYAFYETPINESFALRVTDSKYINKDIAIENVIDDVLYFSENKYLVFYDLNSNKENYFPLGNAVDFEKAVNYSKTGSVYIIRNTKLFEVTPDLKEKEIAKGLITEKNSYINRVYNNNNDYIAIEGNDIMIINLTANSIYTLLGTDDTYTLAGIDSNYVYFKDYSYDKEKNCFNLYRLPIGEQDLSKKEHIFDVDELYFCDNYFLNQTSQPQYPVDELYKINLTTMQQSKVYPVFIYDAAIKDGYLYYVKGNNGGVYKTSLANNNPKRIYTNKNKACEIEVNKDSIFIGTWDGSSEMYRTDLNGNNLQLVSNDDIDYFVGSNDNYVAYVVENKFARYSYGDDTVEILSELSNNPIPASVDGSSVFYDVSDKDWFAKDLYLLNELNIISGYNGYFNPENTFTVEQFLKTLCTTINGNIEGSPNEYWSVKYINFAIDNGYILDNQFNDYTREIKRGEMAEIIAKALNLKSLEETKKTKLIKEITDYDTIPDTYKDAILSVYNEGIITGYTDKTFKSENNLTRAEASVVISRIKNKLSE